MSYTLKIVAKLNANRIGYSCLYIEDQWIGICIHICTSINNNWQEALQGLDRFAPCFLLCFRCAFRAWKTTPQGSTLGDPWRPNAPLVWNKSHLRGIASNSCKAACFSCYLEECELVKYSKNAVGSFKNTMYRKSENINPRSDFSSLFICFSFKIGS